VTKRSRRRWFAARRHFLPPCSAKGLSRNNLVRFFLLSREDCVVPVSVETVAAKVDLCDFFLADLPSLWILLGVELRSHRQARLGGGLRDEVHNNLVAD